MSDYKKITIESKTMYGPEKQPSDDAIVLTAIAFFTCPFWIAYLFNLFS